MARLRRSIDAYGITTRTLEVLRVADVTPGMRRVTMGGPQLAAHIAPNGNPVAAFRSDGFDDAIEVVLDRPDQPGTDRPTQTRSRSSGRRPRPATPKASRGPWPPETKQPCPPSDAGWRNGRRALADGSSWRSGRTRTARICPSPKASN